MFQHSMLRSPLKADGPPAARVLTLAATLATLVFMLLATGSLTPAEGKSTKRVELGVRNMNSFPPNCGRDFSRNCVVEGKLTAFQSLTAKYPRRNFVVPFHGKLVAWSISLANPTRIDIDNNPAQLPAFNLIFGSPSKAGISILRQVEKKKKGGPRYKLIRRSPVQVLNPYFGNRVTFALDQPLNVRKGHVVALTIPTWAPALWQPRTCNFLPAIGDVLDPERCDNAHKRYTWRGSRVPLEETCKLSNVPEPNEQLSKTRPQTGPDSVRRYGCYYGGSVLLYSAIIVGR